MAEKNKIVCCRLTDSDYTILTEHSYGMNLSRSEYLRYLIRIPISQDGIGVEGKCVALDTGTFGDIHTELVRWGHHYNQAVHAMNTIALQIKRGRIDKDFFAELMEKATAQLEKTEAGRIEIMRELERLETLTLIGG